MQRLLAVFAAIMIVCAVGLGTLEPWPEPLAALLARINAGLPDRMQALVGQWCGPWAWAWLVLPIMQRPAWISPAALALISIGVALSLPARKPAPRSRRRS